MAEKSREVHIGREEEGQESSIMDADLISKLPDHDIHHILSFLPSIDSVRASLLSRRWSIESEFFYNFVQQLLEHHKMGMHRFTNSVLTRLKHDMYYHGCQSQVDIYGEWETIKIDAVNLRSFFYGGGQCTCHSDFTSRKKIKYLSLAGACFHPDNDFGSPISGLPVLESLALSESEVIDIRNDHLKMFCDNKLVKFLMNSPNLLETDLAFYCNTDADSKDWYINLIDFLSYLDCSKSIIIVVPSEEPLVFREKLRKFCRSPLSNLKHLKVRTRGELRRQSDFKDALLWLSPSLETLSIQQSME
ncbi:hypothetical protein TIFTF001_002048 [Ficus carica]|uniref:F-box domain-containing protein n=1 Tax=Ficus carica TaxID=3494 RepID=A0AA87Z488_FICCA|nr:hypothetical protein TIFTF001_002048 [Ficus carica]